ncbi:type IV secretory system conjugative DNA transfer family protein [Hydrogenophaga sp. MI9]|uniref:type IV secretory system conjugative DNA transfer family protein n=1 Tax=Hydrogenophaga sp. MI9 TaxID=3453719 RepID=UPI003EE92139
MRRAAWLLALVLLVVALATGTYLSTYLMAWWLDLPLQQLGWTDYWRYWSAYADAPRYGRVIKSSGMIGFAVPVLLLGGLALVLLMRKKPSLYGEARFATLGDLRSRKMLKPEDTALVVGKKDGQFVYFNGQQFALLAAPTRSGKGVGIVIPNLLSYQGSVVVLDIKQENFDLTSGFRARYGQSVYLFNPFAEDRRTHRWNPLSYVSQDPNFRVSDVQSIAAMLYPVSDLHKDPFWANQAQNAFVAFSLYAFEQSAYMAEQYDVPFEVPTMGGLYRLASGRPGQEFKAYLGELAAWPHLSPSARTAFSTLLGQANETFASIMGTFKEPLNPWLNPVVDAATSADDFDLRDVRKRKMSIYVAIQPNKLAESRLILNLFFSQLINQNTRELPQANPDLKHQCLLLMDEFTSIGRIDIIAHAVSFMAGYNLRLMPIIQSMAQLESTYGKENARTIMTNHALRIIFAPREQQDANEYSEMLGYTGVRKDSVSRSRSRESSVTRSESEERRALMLPQELKAMGDDKQILLVEGMAHPVMSEKIRYFQDAIFKERLLPKVDVPPLVLPSDRPAATTTRVASAVVPLRPQDLPADVPSVQQSLERQFEVHRERTPDTPMEYTGLGGVTSEIDAVLAQLER